MLFIGKCIIYEVSITGSQGGLMRLHEYQSKALFAINNIPIPKGRVIESPEEAKVICAELGNKVIIKAQVLVGGRGKGGGVHLARNPEEAVTFSRQILGMTLKDLPVRKVMVEEAVSIEKEIYLSITNDRISQKPILIASSAGGMDIEEVAQASPDKIIRRVIDPLLGLRDYQLRDVAINIDLDRSFWQSFGELVNNLWKVYVDCDCSLVEVNPLAITTDGKLIALDAKVILDDNALFRHPSMAELRDKDTESSAELEGRRIGVSFIRMNGNIGCLVNGAGLAMASMDIIKHMGGEPANFLDIGGGATAVKVAASLKLILSDPKVKAVLINVFGGITRCDEVAKGVMDAFKILQTDLPVVVRLVGTNDEEGMSLIKDTHLIPANSLMEAARIAVAKAGEVKA